LTHTKPEMLPRNSSIPASHGVGRFLPAGQKDA
jgi:hypothetical protein